jgi:hypothetical protein
VSYQIRMNNHTIKFPLRELLFIAPSRQERQEHKRIVALFASLREYTYVSVFGIRKGETLVLHYEELMKNPERLLALTGLKHEEIERMLPFFEAAWEDHRKNDHRPQEGRKRALGASWPGQLRRAEDKLLFILVYFTVSPLQDVQG